MQVVGASLWIPVWDVEPSRTKCSKVTTGGVLPIFLTVESPFPKLAQRLSARFFSPGKFGKVGNKSSSLKNDPKEVEDICLVALSDPPQTLDPNTLPLPLILYFCRFHNSILLNYYAITASCKYVLFCLYP